MCLDGTTKRRTTKKYGWKVLRPVLTGWATGDQIYPVALEKWLVDGASGNLAAGYPAGFHVFLSKRMAEAWRPNWSQDSVFKVDFKQVVAQGEQTIGGMFAKVVVAREIYIHEPE